MEPTFEFDFDVEPFGLVLCEIYEGDEWCEMAIYYPWEEDVGGDPKLYDIFLADTIEELIEMSLDEKYADYKEAINLAIELMKNSKDEIEYQDAFLNYFEDRAIDKLIEELEEEAKDTGWDDSTRKKINYILDNLKRNNFIFERNYEGRG